MVGVEIVRQIEANEVKFLEVKRENAKNEVFRFLVGKPGELRTILGHRSVGSKVEAPGELTSARIGNTRPLFTGGRAGGVLVS